MLDQSCKWLSSNVLLSSKILLLPLITFLEKRFSSQWKQRQRAASKIPNTWGLRAAAVPLLRTQSCRVPEQVFQHRSTPGAVLPYWPLWDLKGHRDPCVSPLIMTLTHNEDDFLCHLATQRLKLTSWEKGSCFLVSSRGAPGAEHPWLLAIRGIPKQYQSKKGLVERQNVSLKNKSKHCLVGGLLYCYSWFKLGFWWRRKCSNSPHNQWGLADTPDSSLPQF